MALFVDLVKAITGLRQNHTITEDTVFSLSTHLPETFTLTDLADAVRELIQMQPKSGLWLMIVCLRNKSRIRSDSESDSDAVGILCDLAAATISPCSKFDGDQDADSAASDYDAVASRTLDLAPDGLEVLQVLAVEYEAVFSDETLLTVIAHAENPQSKRTPGNYWQEDLPWVSPETSNIASQTLNLQLARRHSLEDVLVETVLKGYLRPLFSRSSPRNVTASGRKAEFAEESSASYDLRDESKEVKPWKYMDHRAIPVFQWAVETAEDALVSKQWPLYTPVLTTLLADNKTRVRWRGLYCLRLFVQKLPGEILSSTGLGNVFRDAVFPTLHYLPQLTPVDESAKLLTVAYAALQALSQKSKPKDQKLLDKIMRDGIFSAYFHAKEYPRIVVILSEQISWIVEAMGMSAVKHLKDLIPMFSEILTEPFITQAPRDLSRKVSSVQVVIQNCWPRIAATQAYQDEIIRFLVTCFLNVRDEKLGSAAEAPLVKTASMLSTVMKSPGDQAPTLEDKVAPLVAREPALSDLFKEA